MTAGRIFTEDCLQGLKNIPDECVQTCITSPPYWKLRDYDVKEQLGMELTPEAYVSKLVEIFTEVKRVLKPDGTLWLNLGDVYFKSKKQQTRRNIKTAVQGRRKHNGLKTKDLIGLPWMVAFALREQGWYLRQDIIWHKPSPMVESVTDRCTKAHEYIFLLSKSRKYYFDNVAIKTAAKGASAHDRISRPGRKAADQPLVNALSKERGPYITANRRSVWSINNRPFRKAHFATFPPEVPELCILAGSRKGDLVLDPFMGAGTTALVARQHNRRFIGFELNPDYVRIAEVRLLQQGISIEKLIREN